MDVYKTQFVYKREVEIPPVQEDKEKGIKAVEGYTKTVYESFNIDSVTRTIALDDGRLLILLDDIHERNQEVPKFNKVTGQPVRDSRGNVKMIEVRDTFQSEIYLSEEEGKKFLMLTGINSYE